jgi:hypothetical protein
MTLREQELLKVHGLGNCHVCGQPKTGTGDVHCSYPHGMLPKEQITPGMWSWEAPPTNGENASDTKEG